jgi:hypothetical protein
MSPSKEVDISRALDTAETRGASGDPIMRKPRIALQDGKEKYDCSKKKAVQALATLTPLARFIPKSEAYIGRWALFTGGLWSPKQGRGPVTIKTRHARRIRGKKVL